MNSQTKICQNCEKDFQIDPEDFEFYEKINVPPPTFCPECRMIRRMVVSNERSLYKISCGLCGKNIISMYHQKVSFPVYCIDCWQSDKWEAIQYGYNYNFSKSFFEQLFELKQKVPRIALLQQGNMANSEYTNRASNNNNCYLIFRANFNENCCYSHPINNSRDCFDCLNSQKSGVTHY
ncbi:hypothetical protein HY750_00665 [Candidatus Kuenenbacteria bacterium]|nr:hypothetical protein [Candidatus Kuenenbacteria bacterium]